MAEIKYGEYISENLSKILLKYVSRQDLKNVHISTGVSASTLNQIRTMNNVVTERSSEAMNQLLKIAYKNAESKEKEALKCKKELRLIIQS